MAYKNFDTHTSGSKTEFGNRYLHGVRDGEIDSTLILLAVKLSERMNFQNNSFYILIHKVPLSDVKVVAWCATRVSEQILVNMKFKPMCYTSPDTILGASTKLW